MNWNYNYIQYKYDSVILGRWIKHFKIVMLLIYTLLGDGRFRNDICLYHTECNADQHDVLGGVSVLY